MMLKTINKHWNVLQKNLELQQIFQNNPKQKLTRNYRRSHDQKWKIV